MNTTCLLSIWISLACARASKLTTTNMYKCRVQLKTWSSCLRESLGVPSDQSGLEGFQWRGGPLRWLGGWSTLWLSSIPGTRAPVQQSEHAVCYYSDVTCASWRLKSPATRLFDQWFVQPNYKKSKLWGIGDSPLGGSQMRGSVSMSCRLYAIPWTTEPLGKWWYLYQHRINWYNVHSVGCIHN